MEVGFKYQSIFLSNIMLTFLPDLLQNFEIASQIYKFQNLQDQIIIALIIISKLIKHTFRPRINVQQWFTTNIKVRIKIK